MIIHNPILTGSFTYNGADISSLLSSSANITSLNAATASLNTFSASVLTFTGSVNTFTGSANSRLSSLEAATASLYTATSSFSGRVGALESYTASQNIRNTTYATTGSNTLVGTQYISNTNNAIGFSNTTASIYTDGGLQVTKDAYFSSSMFIKGNLTVFGTQSVSFITSSQLNISTNIITVNTSTPSIRFGGLAVQDSGSTGLTGSILWDSQDNQWIYSNPSGSAYDSALFLVGPRSTGALGSEVGITTNALAKGDGLHHMTSSGIFEVSGSVGIGTSAPTTRLHISGTTGGLFEVDGAAAINALFVSASGNVGIGTTNPTYILDVFNSTEANTRIKTSNASGLAGLYIGNGNRDYSIITRNSAGSVLEFRNETANATVFSISGSNVGIGTPTPSDRFTVTDASTYTFNVGAASGGAGAVLYTLGSAALTFATSGSSNERMRITSTGNVNIGNATSAAYGLTGNSNLATNMGITFHNNSAGFSKVGAIISVQESGGSHAMALYTRSGGDEGERIRITSGGNVGIGITSPQARLDVLSTLNIQATGNSDVPHINFSNNGRSFDWGRIGGLLQGDGDGSLYFQTKLGGSLGTRLTITSTGTATFSSTARATRFEIIPSGTFRVNTDGDAVLGYMLRSGTWKGTTENNLALATDGPYGIAFYTNGSAVERMFITSGGNVGIGTTSPVTYGSRNLDVNAGSGLASYIVARANNNSEIVELAMDGGSGYLSTKTAHPLRIRTQDATRIIINTDGRVWINGNMANFEQSSAILQVNGFSRVQQTIFHNGANVAQAVSVACNGADSLNVAGAFSANSKSFLIPHPLANLESTHNLRYVSVEAPQADLYYRGKLTLVNGRGQANIDESATMTEGTFEALCREVQCFTTNETGWDLIKGKVIGNIIYIESQNTESTDEISWLVIGERKDKHMMDTSWTDENGKVIVEPLAPEETTII